MKLVHVYLNFPGTTREAFAYYESVFRTKTIAIQTYGETPFAGDVSDDVKDKVMNAQLPIANAPWGPYFGMCTDKFGIQWMISLDHAA
jgi:uncharacterized glyoxalase superfamily protein PhnB